MRRLTAFAVLTTLLVVIISNTSAAATFSDVTATTPYSSSITTLRERGVLEGYADGSFKPNQTINRAEFLKIVLGARGSTALTTGGGTIEGSRCFPDVNEEWFASFVCAAKEEEIVGGYPDGLFRPEQNINFAEASKILSLAYGQEPHTYGDEWFKGYVDALEASRAIPPSIAGFDRELKRGELAEMMVRLSDSITDRESQSFLNIKYPEATVDFSSKVAQTASSCADIRALAEASAGGYGGAMKGLANDMVFEAMPMAPQAGMARTTAESDSAGADFSRTNVQVEGIDEADIIKTDGSYLYIIRDDTVTIVRAKPASSLAVVSTIKVSGNTSFSPQELYVEGNRLIVIGSEWQDYTYPMPMEKRMGMPDIWPGPMNRNRTVVRIYDIADPTKPWELRKLAFDGSSLASRRIGEKLYLVLNQGMYWGYPMPLAEVKDTELLPTYSDTATNTADAPVARCSDIVVLPRVPSPQYLITAVIPTDDAKGDVHLETIVGNGENIYMSEQNLYVAATNWNYLGRGSDSQSNQSTTLYRFKVTADGLDFDAQGEVPGRILNQFSMDEWNSMIRVATTEDQAWNGSTEVPSENNLFVLNQDMEVTGSVEEIAPGETIYSTRFIGPRAYMVTFKKVDPFFVIDTSDPREPKILGKLKIPGYSDYLHPYDQNHIIGFGKEAVEAKEGGFAWYQGMKIAVFDVTDVENPIEKHKLAIGDRGTDSPLLHNHKALLFDKERNLIAFPVSIADIPEGQQTPDGMAWGQTVFQGAVAYEYTLAGGFKKIGDIAHYTNEDRLKSGDYLYGKDVERVLRIGESLLTVSHDGVQSHTIAPFKQEGSMTYTEPEPINGTCPVLSEDAAYYISTDPDTCATVRFACPEGMEAFSASCGCGCQDN